jgi:hypothetical protein
MRSKSPRKRMEADFETNIPAWTDRESIAFHQIHGDIISASVHRAIPYGVTMKLLSASGTAFGPMLLNPVVVENLIHLLQQENTLL